MTGGFGGRVGGRLVTVSEVQSSNRSHGGRGRVVVKCTHNLVHAGVEWLRTCQVWFKDWDENTTQASNDSDAIRLNIYQDHVYIPLNISQNHAYIPLNVPQNAVYIPPNFSLNYTSLVWDLISDRSRLVCLGTIRYDLGPKCDRMAINLRLSKQRSVFFNTFC